MSRGSDWSDSESGSDWGDLLPLEDFDEFQTWHFAQRDFNSMIDPDSSIVTTGNRAWKCWQCSVCREPVNPHDSLCRCGQKAPKTRQVTEQQFYDEFIIGQENTRECHILKYDKFGIALFLCRRIRNYLDPSMAVWVLKTQFSRLTLQIDVKFAHILKHLPRREVNNIITEFILFDITPQICRIKMINLFYAVCVVEHDIGAIQRDLSMRPQYHTGLTGCSRDVDARVMSHLTLKDVIRCEQINRELCLLCHTRTVWERVPSPRVHEKVNDLFRFENSRSIAIDCTSTKKIKEDTLKRFCRVRSAAIQTNDNFVWCVYLKNLGIDWTRISEVTFNIVRCRTLSALDVTDDQKQLVVDLFEVNKIRKATFTGRLMKAFPVLCSCFSQLEILAIDSLCLVGDEVSTHVFSKLRCLKFHDTHWIQTSILEYDWFLRMCGTNIERLEVQVVRTSAPSLLAVEICKRNSSSLREVFVNCISAVESGLRECHCLELVVLTVGCARKSSEWTCCGRLRDVLSDANVVVGCLNEDVVDIDEEHTLELRENLAPSEDSEPL